MMTWILPSSSSILHLTVPTNEAVKLPLITMILGFDSMGGVIKSDSCFVMDTLAQLSIKMSNDPESKDMVCALSLGTDLESFCCFGATLMHKVGCANNSSGSLTDRVVVLSADGGGAPIASTVCTPAPVTVPVLSCISSAGMLVPVSVVSERGAFAGTASVACGMFGTVGVDTGMRTWLLLSFVAAAAVLTIII